ncbi:N-acyl-D-amino-acid deacylase family protein [Stenotrophomonas rhizophila]|uniref:N-acyl-D-amino-acid deacylase n=1 Tax=Stenotrophomonas rhizophila TaxID=216778 RepID=A0AAW5PHC5_9GAMM|nr:D-aminoacylase [Stenotrophomonas rhizophila]MCS4279265.1 N-acyl-D-amino-acid deacylase [Stenotrophomonas rhizophila]
MKRTLLWAGVSMLFAANAAAADYDLVIRGGRVLDGAGNPWVRADVAVKEGRVVQVGQVPGQGTREIDATGRYVSPGFIDMMDQSGAALLKDGAAENKLRMGVTTLIGGEGGPPVPAAGMPGYFKQLETQGIAVNFGTYYSSTQARVHVMGDAAGAPTPKQLEAMGEQVKMAMEAGAFGISSALIYAPSSFQSTSDLISLAKVAAQCDGFYATHMRDESEGVVKAIEEAIEIGEKGGVKVEIFHLKAAYAPEWGKLMPQALATITAARDRGVDVAADLYPYTAGGTGLEIIAPSWVWADGLEKGIERVRDPKVRERMKKEVAAGSMPGWSNLVHASGGFQNVRLANSFSEKYRRFHGKTLAEIGAELNLDPADAAWDIALEGLPNRAVALYFMISEADVQLALRQPWVSIGSDAAAAVNYGSDGAIGLPHPRAYGTFPRILAEYVKRRQVLTLEDAVRKMTSWPAQRMGLSDRGLIREGMRADIVLFDLDTLDDVASWDAPAGAPTGIDTVIVNGVVSFEDGKHTGARAGSALRHPCRTR